MPDVSVLTPSFNYGVFIEDAIRSVAGQQDVRVEHIVQDGASTDHTTSILERYGTRLAWRSEPDAGQSEALNRALERANGRWIAWLNADEFYLPGALAALVSAGDDSGADLVYGDALFADRRGRAQRLVPQHPFNRTVLRIYGTFIATCSCLIRRSRLPNDSWDTDLRMLMDKDLYLRLEAEGRRFVYIPRAIGVFRRHESQVTAAPAAAFGDEYRALEKRYGLPSGRVAKLGGRLLHSALKASSGSYLRQLQARSLRGTDLRWFVHDEVGEGYPARAAE